MSIGAQVGAAETCRWFASIFAWELSAENIEAYRAGAAAPFLARLEHDGGAADAGHAFVSAIDAWGPDTPATQRRLAADFSMLLVLPGPDHVSPYASSYHGDGVLMGVPHDAMVAALSESNLGVSSDVKEPADHLSVMLDYAGFLAAEDPTCHRAGAFVREHLSDWIGRFAEGVQSRERIDPFYRASAACISLYLQRLARVGNEAPVS